MATLTIADLDNGKIDLETIEGVANSHATQVNTRYGGPVATLHETIRRINSEGDSQLSAQNDHANEVISNLGFRVPVGYSSGLEIIDSRVTVRGPDGIIYAPLNAPFVTDTWNPAQWYVLQNDLNDHKLLVFNTFSEAEAAAATLPDGQLVVSDSDEVRGVVNAGVIEQEQSVYKVADYAKIRSYTGRGTRMRVVDPTGAHWWVRKGTAADNGGTILKDGSGRSWVREYPGPVNVLWFGAVGDGVADDTLALQAALNSTSCACIHVPINTKIHITSNLDVPEGASIVGEAEAACRSYTTVADSGSALILDNTATINLSDSAMLRGLRISRRGVYTQMSYDEVVATFLGQAVYIKNGTGNQTIKACTFIGFYTAIANNPSDITRRVYISDLQIGCRNGIHLYGSYDISRIENVQCVPLLTEGRSDEWKNLAYGLTAFKIGGVNDWTKLNGCFSYGFQTGFLIEDASNVTLTSCGADTNPASASHVVPTSPSRPLAPNGSKGFVVAGTAKEIVFIGCQSAATDKGFYINSTYGVLLPRTATLIGCSSWNHYEACCTIVSGNVAISEYLARSAKSYGKGIETLGTNGSLIVNGAEFDGVTHGITQESPNRYLQYSNLRFTGVAIIDNKIVNPYVRTIPSADPLVLDGVFQFFNVSGTISFGSIYGDADTYAGKTITLKFLDTLKVYDGGSNLKLNGEFNATADDTLTLVSDGTAFYEVARSSN